MSKKPHQQPSSAVAKALAGLWAVAKRNPVSTVAGLVAIFGGIPAAVAGANYVQTQAEPFWLAQHGWVRDHTSEKVDPILKLAQQHSIDIDFLILKEQRKALSEAKDDLKRDPTSTSAPAVIENLQRSIDVRQKRIDESTKK